MEPPELYADLVCVLEPRRRRHTVAVGRKAAAHADRAPARLRGDLVAAATLHDIGYAYPVTGFHPLDGAQVLHGLGFSPLVCHLVATHTAAHLEAAERGIPPAAFERWADPEDDSSTLRALLRWADLTTGPDGQDMTIATRLGDILARYPDPADPVHRYVSRHRCFLLATTLPTAGT